MLVVGGLALDLWSKHWAFHTLRQGGARVLIPNVLEFHTTMNPGALFGIGAGMTSVFVVASILAIALVVWMFSQTPRARWLTQIALGAILAGALGNLYDRVTVRLVPTVMPGNAVVYCEQSYSPDGARVILREYPVTAASRVQELPREFEGRLRSEHGYVRDFIKISKKWFGGRDVWPWVFNVADMLLVGGVCTLALRMLTERRPEPVVTRAEASTPEARPSSETGGGA